MIKYKVGSYIPSDLMSDLICDNYLTLLVMSRFGIDLGFGEDTIEQVCQKSGVDLMTFLAVVNLMVASDKSSVKIDYSQISLSAMVQYLHNSHSYFLEYRLPSIRSKLVEALDGRDDGVSVVIVNYYDEYTAEVNKHMMYEENTLFPYIRSIIGELESRQYSVDVYSKHHSKIESKLSELKGIIIKYYPTKTSHELTSVLYDIYSSERDLATHTDLEDLLLVPAIEAYEEDKK